MTIFRIRRCLEKRRDTLFFTPAERALLAVLELREYKTLDEARINATYTQGAQTERARINRAIESAWDGLAA